MPTPKPSNAVSLFSKPILIVEDDPVYREVLYETLKSSNYRVYTAENGREAIELIRGMSFRLVLLDQELPKMSGLEVLSMLKSEPGSQNTKVIMLTSHKERELVTKAREDGAVAYLIKPVSRERLLDAVQRHLEN